MKKETLPPYLVLSRLAPEFGLPLTSPSLGFSLEDPSFSSSAFPSSTNTPPINKPDHQLQFNHFLDDDLFMTVPKTTANSVVSMAIEAPSGKDHAVQRYLGFDDSDLKEFSFEDSEGIVPAKAEGIFDFFLKAEVKEELMEVKEDAKMEEEGEENEYEEMSLPIEEGASSDEEENGSGSSEEDGEEEEEDDEEEEEELDSDDSDFEDGKGSKRPKRGVRVHSSSSNNNNNKIVNHHNTESEGTTTTKRGARKGQKRAGGRRKKAPKEPVVKERKKPGRKPKILDEETKRIRGQIRQEKNRMAARKCREKKQGYFLLLEGEVAKLRGEKDEMAKELVELRSLVQTLQSKLRGA